MDNKFAEDMLALSHVPRWSIVRTIGSQSVAEHAFRVAVIAMWIHEKLADMQIPKDVRRFNLTWLALTHDVNESVTGDIPSPAKAAMRGTREVPAGLYPVGPEYGFTSDEMTIVKLADLIEAWVFLTQNSIGCHASNVLNFSLRPRIDLAVAAVFNARTDEINEFVQDLINETHRLRA